MAQVLARYRVILHEVFPSTQPTDLEQLSEEDLDQLLTRYRSSQLRSPMSQACDITPRSTGPEAQVLETLQPLPDQREDVTVSESETDLTENSQRSIDIKHINRDVNTMPLSFKHPTTYLGVSMPPAALRVIRDLYPQCKDVFRELQAQSSGLTSNALEARLSSRSAGTEASRFNESSAWKEIPLINAYFDYFHPSQPLLDEQLFRATYMSDRDDSRWKLLLNLVLALGSIAASPANDSTHHIYYERAQHFLGPEPFRTIHWETVQALGLLGGVYLHYLHRPDEGNAMVGAALRMAVALGMHRDCSTQVVSTSRPRVADGENPSRVQNTLLGPEMRCRIWWSLFNIDTWAHTGLGRPSMGRMSNAVTVKIPTEPIVHTYSPEGGRLRANIQMQGESAEMTELFRDSVQYCIVSMRIEDAMSISPFIDDVLRKELDQALVDWFHTSSVQSPTSIGTIRISASKDVLRWRFHLSRVILHRPILLWYALCRKSPGSLTLGQTETIQACRKAADDLIIDIATNWHPRNPCQFVGMHATWFLYQAAMVPLLSLFADYQVSETVVQCQRQIERTKTALIELQPWSTIAPQALDSVSFLYEASQRYAAQQQRRHASRIADTQIPVSSSDHFCGSGQGFHEADQLVGEGSRGLDDIGSEGLMDSSILEDLSWDTDWDNIDFMLNLRDMH